MKKHALLFIPMTLLLTFCSNDSKTISQYKSLMEYDYSDIEHLKIEWKDILNKDNSYYVYIYSENCGHCRNIKLDVLNYALSNEGTMYFKKYDKEIPIYDSTEDTLGTDDYRKIGILGTPTLLGIDNHILVSNITGEEPILQTLYKE